MISLPILLWAQAPTPNQGMPLSTRILLWLVVWGEPSITDNSLLFGLFKVGGLITWTKVVGLFCLLGWVGSRLIAASKEPRRPGNRPFDVAALVGLIGGLDLRDALNVLDQTGRIKLRTVLGGLVAHEAFGLACGFLIVAWVEFRLWTGLGRGGRKSDLVLLGAMHLALVAGFGVVFGLKEGDPRTGRRRSTWSEGLRMGGTYMGLTVLAWVVFSMRRELAALRFRRLYAIAWQAWVEAFRRMGAPWVVLVVFGLIMLFFDWFDSSRTAEMGRSYVEALMFLAAVLMMLMVTILAPISLPNDIRQQTIYTIVSKPVRRLELIWGRMLGYMALVTVLLAIFGVVSIVYLDRNIGGEIARTQADAEAAKAGQAGHGRGYEEQANQLRTRMSARVPVKGSLVFLDSRGRQRPKGIDVGQEMEFRSHIEGATPSKAIWRFGIVDDPDDYKLPPNRRRRLDRRIPVDSLLQPGTIEYVQNQMYELSYEGREAEARLAGAGATGKESFAKSAAESRTKAEDRDPSAERARLLDPEGERSSSPAYREGPRRGEGGRGAAAPRAGPGAALPADPDRDELHRLPDDQGRPRRAGRRLARRGQPEAGHPAGDRRLPDPRVLHGQAVPPGPHPRRQPRLPDDRGPVHEPQPIPGHGRERPAHPGQPGQLRAELPEGPVRDLAPGDGPDRDRPVRRHVPELAGRRVDDDRLLRRGRGRLRVPPSSRSRCGSFRAAARSSR